MAFGPDNRFQGGPSAWNQPLGRAATDAATIDAGLRAYMLRVYNWMASGLALTGIVAYLIAHNPAVAELFYTVVRTPRGLTTAPTGRVTEAPRTDSPSAANKRPSPKPGVVLVTSLVVVPTIG